MSRQAPLAIVKAEFGTKEKLAAQLASTMDIPEGQSKEQFQKFLKTLSNAKLLKLKRVEDQFTARFGGKTEKAVGAIVEKRGATGKAADALRQELQGLSRARLLDLAGPAKAAKKA
ncbi:MAG: hypothetical protein AB2A00_36000 [Myxococcota bacterium]